MAFQSRNAPPIVGTGTVLDLFGDAVARCPEAPALQHAGRTLSYRELDAAADAVAAALLHRGLAPATAVAIVMDTGIDHVVAMLGVLKAGAAYIPLHPTLPPARIERMLAVADCTTVLVDDAGAGTCAALAARAVLLPFADLDATPTALPAPAPSQLACILFTSGSTGDPKGVRTLHGNLAYYADWSSRFFAENAHSRVPLTAAPHYAAATSQIYACLCAGGTLHILDEALGQPARLLDFYSNHPGHALHCVPTVWRALLDRLERGDGRGRPAALFLSGEHLPQDLVERTFALDPALPVWNLYGPTECVANISAQRLRPGAPVGIGAPLPGSRLFVVDDEGRESGEGAEGRLLVAGPGVCAGYLGADARSSAQFFEFTAADGRHIAVYDTGDRARRCGGDIQLLGRRDQQVKLRGVRIELADIESNLLRHADVAQAAVLLADRPEPRLVAFVQPRHDHATDAGSLWRHLNALLPASMLPERWSLQVLPQLANGKIDRASLRAQLPDLALVRGPTASDAFNDTEGLLASLFDRVLDVRGTGLHDDFFALGGHSLKVYALLAAIEETWGVQLSFGCVYSEPTVAGLARRLPAMPGATHAGENGASQRLSASQRGLWLLQQADAGSTAYNLCYRIGIDTAVSEAHLRACIATLCERHVLLRCSVEDRRGDPGFRVHADAASAVTLLDLATMPCAQRDAALDHALGAVARTALGREGDLLHRWQLIRLAPERQVLVFVAHHLIFDGLSASLLLRELFELLAGAALPAVRGSYSDFVVRQERYLDSPRHRQDRDFWSKRLDGLVAQPGFPVPGRLHGSADLAGGRLRFTLPASERVRLAALARREDCSLHVLLLTAFAAVLDRFEPRAEFLIAAPFANRLHADERDIVGYFTALLFYRLQWQAGTPLRALAARIRQDTIALLDHQRLPFPELAALLRERLQVLPPTTFRLMFGYHDSSSWRASGGLPAHAEECFAGEAKCDLHLECFDDGESLELALTHRHAALDPRAAADWFECYRDVVADLESFLALQPHEWPAPSGVQAARILRDSRGERIETALTQTIPGLFAAAAARFAQRTAIWHAGVEISYADLAARVDALAARLLAEPAAAAGPIGICMPHQADLLVALLACARCGFPYVPLDPAFPAFRIATIIEQAGARLLLTGASSPALALPADIVRMDVTHGADVSALAARRAGESPEQLPPSPSTRGSGDFKSLNAKSSDSRVRGNDENKPSGAEVPGVPVTPQSLLYIIYTSGSTGVPKGVMVPQRGVVNYLLWMQQRFGTGPDTRILAKTSISFDISTWELLLPLIGGGCVVLGSREETESPESLAKLIVAGAANVVQFVPSGLGLFVEAGMLAQVPCVQQVFCGGEALPRTLESRVFEAGFRGELYNLYGPTEASIFMSCHACTADPAHAAVPIGRPIPNSSLYVLDERLRLLPPNVAGDLHIGGAVLADGYWRDEQKTNATFIAAPPGVPETRLYRTGDKGRLLSDGSFDYLGRDDQQVKIRGYRVELREIEQHLRAHPAVQDAAAFTRHWGENDVRLHAAVVARTGAALEGAELLAWLKARLPAWMLPCTLPQLAALPRLANGKTDYQRLRDLVEEDTEQSRPAPALAARDGIERVVAAIWRDVLGHAEFGARDSFFDAGGHSMLFLKVRELLRERLQADFTIAELYKAPNVAEMARTYREKIGATVVAPLVSQIRARIAKRRSRLSQQGE
jgi:amino acid adenylation domain-containing protein